MWKFIIPVTTGIIAVIADRLLQRFGILKPQAPIELRVARVALDARWIFEKGWSDRLISVKVINASSFSANNVRVMFQEYDGSDWLEPPHPHQENTLAGGHDFSVVLSAKPLKTFWEMIEGEEYYFAVRVEWQNPNLSPGHLFRYLRAYGITYDAGTGDDTKVLSPEVDILDDLPEGVPPPAIGIGPS